ncbi:hypothetical protein JW964_13485, partial [candidate division KSB1 bacterium]|nr:hypothetical protein [candidate division KSB1 bacterium]
MRKLYAVFIIFIFCSIINCKSTSTKALPPVFQSLDHRKVKVDGELGRRIDLMLNTNIPKIKFETDFLEHFQHKSAKPEARDGFVGIGMLLDGIVGLACYTQTPEMIERKKYLTEELIKTQEPDGYIGIFS